MGSPEIQDSRVGWYKMMFTVRAGEQPGLYPVDTAQPLKNWKQRTHLTRPQHATSDWESASLFHYFPFFLLTRPILPLSFLLPSQINSFFSYSFHSYGFCWPWMLGNHECREVVLPDQLRFREITFHSFTTQNTNRHFSPTWGLYTWSESEAEVISSSWYKGNMLVACLK